MPDRATARPNVRSEGTGLAAFERSAAETDLGSAAVYSLRAHPGRSLMFE